MGVQTDTLKHLFSRLREVRQSRHLTVDISEAVSAPITTMPTKAFPNFDPNMNVSGNASIKTVRLVFGLWDYRLTVERAVGGNVIGVDCIDQAILWFWEEVMDDGITLLKSDGQSGLLCTDDDCRDEAWLKDMLISAEIVSMVPTEPLWTFRNRKDAS